MRTLAAIAFLSLLPSLVSFAGTKPCDHPTFIISGLNRTSDLWLRDYLQLDQILSWSDDQGPFLRKKIMTTDIFSSAKIEQVPDALGCDVQVNLVEKWTTIPVIRGAYGGGTPLAIIGGYETNAFGRLIAIGGELRRYGSMKPGAFFFFKSPRAWRGRGLWGGELWLDRRQRDFFDTDGQNFGSVKSDSWTAKFHWLYPIGRDNKAGGWQAGFQAQVFKENPSYFELVKEYKGSKKSLPNDIRTNENDGYGGLLAPMLAFDDLSVDGLNYDGQKSKLSLGLAKNSSGSGRFAEAEFYGFLHLPKDINLAGRIFAASTSEDTVGSIYYLGGFDSIRGLPDGIHYGNNIAYGNFEARIMTAKWTYAHLQSALFVDTGSAWMRGGNIATGRETSLGLGIRVAIPQVYRFIVRVDYGVSVGATKSRGVSIGLNQFFQPYKLVF